MWKVYKGCVACAWGRIWEPYAPQFWWPLPTSL